MSNSFFVNYCLLWAVNLGTLIFLSPLVGMYNLSSESTELSKMLILWHVALASMIWPIGFMLPSAFRASGDVRFPMFTSISCMWIFRICSAYFLALESVNVFGLFTVPGLGMGINGVWIAMFIDWVVRVCIYIFHYVRGKWILEKTPH